MAKNLCQILKAKDISRTVGMCRKVCYARQCRFGEVGGNLDLLRKKAEFITEERRFHGFKPKTARSLHK